MTGTVSSYLPDGSLNITALESAARILERGGVIIVPTDTVYGLAALMAEPEAVGRIYHMKGRETAKPLVLQVAGEETGRSLIVNWDWRWERLTRLFWPGPLTLVGRRSALVPQVITSGGETVGVRCPREESLLYLLRRLGQPLAVTSANPTGAAAAIRADEAAAGLRMPPDLVLDGGASCLQVVSTVLDLSTSRSILLRSGALTLAELAAVLGSAGLVT
ncbi:threonylcarbamoyl-AMP synthase [bacterium]|nr:threonylcarbamoyl-AMP synthase [candidate division CSSED10-310 bacterium]